MTNKDDWKGEHLIRTRERTEAETARGFSHGGSMVKRTRSVTGVCSVPGGNELLANRTRSGVCRMHNHHASYCQCVKCFSRRNK